MKDSEQVPTCPSEAMKIHLLHYQSHGACLLTLWHLVLHYPCIQQKHGCCCGPSVPSALNLPLHDWTKSLNCILVILSDVPAVELSHFYCYGCAQMILSGVPAVELNHFYCYCWALSPVITDWM